MAIKYALLIKAVHTAAMCVVAFEQAVTRLHGLDHPFIVVIELPVSIVAHFGRSYTPQVVITLSRCEGPTT